MLWVMLNFNKRRQETKRMLYEGTPRVGELDTATGIESWCCGTRDMDIGQEDVQHAHTWTYSRRS